MRADDQAPRQETRNTCKTYGDTLSIKVEFWKVEIIFYELDNMGKEPIT